MPSAYLALLFIFLVNCTKNLASDVRMTSFHITPKAFKNNVSNVPGAFDARSIVDCARYCDVNDEQYFYYDQGCQKCYCNNGTDHEFFITFEMANKTKISFGSKTPQIKGKCKEVCTTNLTGLELSDCQDVQSAGCNISGVYNVTFRGVFPSGTEVFCDMDTDGGGWLVFQRREDGSVNFSRTFGEYEQGFGTVSGEHWLGLSLICLKTLLSDYDSCELRIDLEDWNGIKAYAHYGEFFVEEHESAYQLFLSAYTGDAGNSMKTQRSARFSTVGPTNVTTGGWWHSEDYDTNLNGEYMNGGVTEERGKGIIWTDWKGPYYSLKKTEMKIRCYDATDVQQ